VRIREARRSLIAVLAATCLVLVGCSATVPTNGVTAIPAGELGGLFTSASVPSVEHVLAADGIATVPDESTSHPIVSVAGAVRMTFTLAQVHAMTLEAADHGGVSGATLDGTTRLPGDYPPFAYLLAAWISTSGTPASKEIRDIMGAQKWSDAPQLVFPTVALALFAADVIAASPKPSPSASSQSDGAPAQDGIAETSATEVALVRSGILNAPCSTISNFIQGVLNGVFMALQVGTSSSDGVISGFFKGIWNGAVSLAGAAIQGLVKAITAPVLNAIKTIAGTAVVIAQVVSYLNPWSVKVVADPSSVGAGSGGSFDATVDTGTGNLSYPPAVTDCATSGGLDLKLPALTAADASATWALSGGVGTTDSTSVTMDEHGKSSLSFTSSKDDSAACGSDASADQTGVARITVTRPGVDSLKQLATTMLTNGLGVAGSVVGPVLTSIISPILDSVLSKLSALTDVIGAGTVTITGGKAVDCPGSGTSSQAKPGSSESPSKTRQVAFVCPSVALVKSLLNDPSLGAEGDLENRPGVLLACVYTPPDNTGSCPSGQDCVAEVVFIGGATDDASNFGTGNHLLQPAECDCDVDAYNNTPSSAFSADNALTVLGVLNGVQVGVSYPKAGGVDPGLAVLRSIFSK
jgi:hypothetical protein